MIMWKGDIDMSERKAEVIEPGDNTAPSEVDSPATFAPSSGKVAPQPVHEDV